MLSDVTVIIPAHNRPDRLRRLLDYYSKTDIKILVPDSSVNRFPNVEDYPNIVYFHLPNMHFLQKINKVLSFITTTYVFYCADDDFIVPEAVKQIVSFLDIHPDYHSAQGHYLTFEIQKKKIEFTPRYIRFFDKKIVGDSGIKRLEQYKNFYASNLYSVVRTETFKRMYTVCFTEEKQLRFKNLFLAELYFNLFSLIHGNYATLPIFYSARESMPNSATVTTVPFSVVSTAPEYKQEYEGFITTLAEELAKQDNIELQSAKKFILETIQKPKFNLKTSFMQRVALYMAEHRAIKMIDRLLIMRYKQKGLRAVRGMESYPCTFMTKEKQEIIDRIQAH